MLGNVLSSSSSSDQVQTPSVESRSSDVTVAPSSAPDQDETPTVGNGESTDDGLPCNSSTDQVQSTNEDTGKHYSFVNDVVEDAEPAAEDSGQVESPDLCDDSPSSSAQGIETRSSKRQRRK